MFSVKTQHSDPYTATGLIRALYNFILVFLDISLLWSIFWLAKEGCFIYPAVNGHTCNRSVILHLYTSFQTLYIYIYTHTHTHTHIQNASPMQDTLWTPAEQARVWGPHFHGRHSKSIAGRNSYNSLKFESPAFHFSKF
jgi:hypothetical protein